jgi:hypothetical protein
MNDQARILAALHSAEALAGTGARVAYCLDRAATVHAVDRGALAAAWLEKRVECDRARAAARATKEGDADA